MSRKGAILQIVKVNTFLVFLAFLKGVLTSMEMGIVAR